LGDRPVAVCRELTKAFEEVFRGTLDEALAHFTEPRGEFTLVIAGVSPSARAESAGPPATEDAALEDLRRRKAAGEPAKTAVPAVAKAHGLSRREAYRLWLTLEGPAP
ncbi:MAG TPA: 16S rRNA (cytidine(1402)-2'-O)-methyltransferase, partial [Vicinamibacteria bacterium]